jgi:tetratricopeptide (TPR) repeat protein
VYCGSEQTVLREKAETLKNILEKEFEVVEADLSANLQEMISGCWVLVALMDGRATGATHWQAVSKIADTLKLPAIWITFDAIAREHANRHLLADVLPFEERRTGRLLLDRVRALTSLSGQADWWKQIFPAQSQAKQVRKTGNTPGGLGDFFIGRIAERTALVELLLTPDTSRRVVQLYGWNTGKTALACEVINEVATHGEAIDAVVCVDGSDEHVFEQLYRLVGLALDEHTRQTLEDWSKAGVAPDHRGQYLLDFLGGLRCVILIDGLDKHMDTNGAITHEALRRFVEALLVRDHNARLLITSSHPLRVHAEALVHLHPYPLTEGVSPANGVQLLRQWDKRRLLRDTDDATLRNIVEKARGLPRALILIYALFVDDPAGTTPETILNDETLFFGEIIQKLAREVQSRLSVEAQRVLQAMAVLARPANHLPITLEGINAVLSGYLAAEAVKSALAQLTRLGVVRRVAQGGQTPQYEMQAWDRLYYYETVRAIEADVQHIELLERRAAAWYEHALTSGDTGNTADAVPVRLAQIDHDLTAGDYMDALRVLEHISADPSGRWDYDALTHRHYEEAIAIRHALTEHLAGEYAALNLCHRARMVMSTGAFRQASIWFNEALNHRPAPEIGQLCLIGLGRCAYNQQDFPAAERYWAQVLNDTADPYLRAVCLHGLAGVQRDLEDPETALMTCNHALGVVSQIDGERGRHIAAQLLELRARIYRHMLRISDARDEYKKLLAIHEQSGDRRAQVSVAIRLGMVSQDVGAWQDEEQYQRRALSIAEDLRDSSAQCKAWERLANLHIATGQYEQALQDADMALGLAIRVNNRRKEAYCHLRFGQVYAAQGSFSGALAAFAKAEGMFDRLENRFDQQDCKNQIASLYLLFGQTEQGLVKVEEALTCDTEFFNHRSLLLQGLCLLLLGDFDSVNATLGHAVIAAENILIKTPRFYPARLTRAVALTGQSITLAPQIPESLLRGTLIACGDLHPYRGLRGVCNMMMAQLSLLRPADQAKVVDKVLAVLSREFGED